MRAYADGRHAQALCDRCGQRYGLHELVPQILNRAKTGLKVCPECSDIDHEQLRLGTVPFPDPQALREPRPQNDLEASRKLIGMDEFLKVLYDGDVPERFNTSGGTE